MQMTNKICINSRSLAAFSIQEHTREAALQLVQPN